VISSPQSEQRSVRRRRVCSFVSKCDAPFLYTDPGKSHVPRRQNEKNGWKSKNFLLTNRRLSGKINSAVGTAGVAQLVEQLICNQQVGGSNPSTSSSFNMGEFQSGQMGQTVNLLPSASVVRIHLPPPKRCLQSRALFSF
jgi:hypothetical protein